MFIDGRSPLAIRSIVLDIDSSTLALRRHRTTLDLEGTQWTDTLPSRPTLHFFVGQLMTLGLTTTLFWA